MVMRLSKPNTDDHFSHNHAHSAGQVYPTLAAGVTLTTHANTWVLGTIAEIVPASTITNDFDIHEVTIEDVNTKEKVYELVLYYGASDVECLRVRFSSTTNKGGLHTGSCQTPIIPANSRIRGQLAIEDGGSKTAKVSIRYHTY